MGRPDLAPYVLRVSAAAGPGTEGDWDRFAEAWLGAYARHAERHARQPQLAGA